MLTETERAALEIVRRFRDVQPSEDDGTPRHILADAMLRLFPADDDEPITPEWIAINWPTDYEIVDLCLSFDGHWNIYARNKAGDMCSHVRRVATRGDVRAFLRGMGVDKKGGEK